MEFMTEDFCKKHMYPLILTLLSAIGSVALACAFFGLTNGLMWFTVLFPLLLIPIHFLSVNGKPLLFFLIFPLFSALILFLFLRASGGVEALILSYTEWWTDSHSEELPPYILLLLLPVLLCISLIYLLQRSYISRLILAILQTGLLFTFRLLGYQTGKASVVCFLGFALFLLLETVFLLSFRTKKTADATLTSNDNNIRKVPAFTVQLWPVVLTAMLTLSVLPYGSTPIRWTAVYHLWNTVTSAANDVFQFIRVDLLNFSSEFTLKFSGYDNSGALGGQIFNTYTDSIHVRGSGRTTDTVYLTGNSQNIYTGSGWESELTVPDELLAYSENYLDAAELSYAALRAGLYENHDNLYLSCWYELRFLDYRSSTLFAPAKTTRIEAVFPGDFSFRTDSDAFRFSRLMKKNTQYRTYFNQPNLGSEEFLMLASVSAYAYDNSCSIPSADQHQFTANYRDLPRNEELDALFRLRKATIQDNYLALPASVPYRVYELAISLTEDKESDYEKMLALEAYLRNLRYTNLPEEVPKDRDLVDYFLFDTQEGYCTYYATALSVLGRCIGIPTRYVQGYCTRSSSQYGGEWTVRSNNAHAWTEAYIDGLGWVPLDATPGYETMRYQPWHIEKKAEPTPVPDDGPNWWSSMQEGTEMPEPEPVEPENDSNLFLGMMILLCSSVALICLLLLYILYRKLHLDRFLRNAAPEERFYYEAAQIFILTGILCGNTRREALFDGVTLTEFTERFVQAYSEVEKHAKHFCSDYSEVRYGTHPVTTAHCTFAIQYRAELLMLLGREKGKRSVVLYRTTELFRY